MELHTYYYRTLTRFPTDRQLTAEEADGFQRFEHELTTLASDRRIGMWFSQQRAVGLSRDRQVRPLRELHRETPQVATLALADADLLDRDSRALDAVFPCRKDASSTAVIRALEHDGARHGALIPRLKALAAALRREERSDQPVRDIACIPHDGDLLAPARLALKGNRGDYWGDWKISISRKGLSADEQALYKEAGVTSSEPDSETSHGFFQWLSQQPDP